MRVASRLSIMKGGIYKVSPYDFMMKETGIGKSFTHMLNRESVMKESLKKCNHKLFVQVMNYNKEKD